MFLNILKCSFKDQWVLMKQFLFNAQVLIALEIVVLIVFFLVEIQLPHHGVSWVIYSPCVYEMF